MKYIISLLLLLTLSGCVSETYQEKNTVNLVTTGDINTTLEGRHTFSWHPTVTANYLNKELNEQDTEQRFSQSLQSTLEKKGYQFIKNSNEVDFYIGYGLGLEENIQDKEILNKTGLLAGVQPIGIENNDESQKASVFIAIFLPNEIYPQWSVLAQGYTHTDNTMSLDELTEFMLHNLSNK